MKTFMVAIDSIPPHQIALKSRLLMESPKAHMSSQYLCGTSRPDMFHIIHEVFIRNGRGEIQQVRALIDCGATSICMTPRLRKRLVVADHPAYVTTQHQQQL